MDGREGDGNNEFFTGIRLPASPIIMQNFYRFFRYQVSFSPG